MVMSSTTALLNGIPAESRSPYVHGSYYDYFAYRVESDGNIYYYDIYYDSYGNILHQIKYEKSLSEDRLRWCVLCGQYWPRPQLQLCVLGFLREFSPFTYNNYGNAWDIDAGGITRKNVAIRYSGGNILYYK